tara:strand:- start:403 stop:1248 length:846 start_codon:yes stop_codon:yes gene_type:complete
VTIFLFLSLASAMVALCLALVLIPIWRAGGARRAQRREANVEIYRQRCAEIDRDVAASRLAESDAQDEKDELGARLLADIDAEPELSARTITASASRRGPTRPWWGSVLLLLFIAFGAAGYGWLGDWQAIEKTGMPNIDQMMAGLKARVQAHPEDRSARLLLAQAQRRQGDNAGAATNFHILNQRSAAPPNTDLIAAEAQARLAAGGDLAGRAGDLYSRLLKLDPNNREALWYLGLRAAEAGRNTKAIHFWDRLLEQHLSTEARAMISSRRRSLLQNKSDP